MSADIRTTLRRLLKEYGLFGSILLGIIAYRPLSVLSPMIPYVLMTMLFFTFSRIAPQDIRPRPIHLTLIVTQIALALGGYFLVRYLPVPFAEIYAQAVLMCFLCPVAAAAPVIVGLLGGSIAIVTSYVVINCLSIIITGPLILGWLGHPQGTLLQSMAHVLVGVLPIVMIPLLTAFGIRWRLPSLHAKVRSLSSASLYIWIFLLSLVIANTVHFVAQERQGVATMIIVLVLIGLVTCIIQYTVGKAMSRKVLGESVTIGQALGQKNSSISIWMIQAYLNPIASVSQAAYSIFQNIFNALQVIHHDRQQVREQRRNHKSMA